VQDTQIEQIVSKFPRFDERLVGRKHRFGYFAGYHGWRDPQFGFNVLFKYDYLEGRSELQDLRGCKAPSEPIFVPRKLDAAEDDGWLLSIWYDPSIDRSELVIQYARDFVKDPVARIKLNHRIPFGFHGSWLPMQG
jgi:carotenoid cleavage dioxygenase